MRSSDPWKSVKIRLSTKLKLESRAKDYNDEIDGVIYSSNDVVERLLEETK